MQCSLERSEDKARWHLTLLLVLEDRLHRQLTYDLLPSMLGRDPGVGGGTLGRAGQAAVASRLAPRPCPCPRCS